jgi:hypothetical protein
MYGTVRATQYGYSIWEFEVYGPEVLADSITLNKTKLALVTGETEQFMATLLPESATNKKVRWSTSNAAVAKVSSSGLVTAVGPGTANVTAITPNGELTSEAEVSVNVVAAPWLQSAIARDGEVSLKWGSVEGATGYQVFSSTSPGAYGTAIANLDGTAESYVAEGLSNGTAYYFVVKATAPGGDSVASNEISAVPQVAAPGAPLLHTIVPGNGQISLQWEPVEGASGYQVFVSNTSGTYDEPTASVTDSVYSYEVTGLQNGTTYYAVIKAENDGGVSAASNEVSAVPMTVPTEPTDISAVAGNGQATVTFTAPVDNGGSHISRYEVLSPLGDVIATGNDSPITITGLTNGVAYTFAVRAVNSKGSGPASLASNTVVPVAPAAPEIDSPPTGGGSPILPTPKPDVTPTETKLIKEVLGEVNGQSVATVSIDAQKLSEVLAAAGENPVIAVRSDEQAAAAAVILLNGQMIKDMQQKGATLEVTTSLGSYTLPTNQVNLDAIVQQLGQPLSLTDIVFRIEIGKLTVDELKAVQSAAAAGGFTLASQPLDFSIQGVYGDKTVEISKFNTYVKRTIPLEGQATGIVTAVVVEPDGTFRPVPTKTVTKDGHSVAEISSLTNSIYALVTQTTAFKDTADHWSSEAVNDMSARMIVSGVGSGLFLPEQEVTRAEFAAMLVRGLGLKLENSSSTYTDVKTGDWYSPSVQTASAYSLISGFTDGTFRPADRITREQAMVMMAKAMEISGLKTQMNDGKVKALQGAFTDAAEVSVWAQASVTDCVQSGIFTGRNGTQLAPKANITRGEAAAVMQRLLLTSGLI